MKRGLSFGNVVNIILVFALIGFGVAYVYISKGGPASNSYSTSVGWMTSYAEWSDNAIPPEFLEENFTPDGKYGEPFGEVVEFCQGRFGGNWEVQSLANWRGLITVVVHGLPTGSSEDEVWVFAIAYDETRDRMVLIDKWEFEINPSG